MNTRNKLRIADLRAISEDNRARRAIEAPLVEDQPETPDSGATELAGLAADSAIPPGLAGIKPPGAVA